MAKTVEQLLALAEACRASAAAEALGQVRQIHLEAAEKWEILAERARWKARSSDEVLRSPLGTTDRAGGGAKVQLSAFDWPRNDSRLLAEPGRARPSCTEDHRPTPPKCSQISNPLESGQLAASPAPNGKTVKVTVYASDGNLRTLEEIEADVISLAIEVYGGRMSEVARRLGIGRSTLYRKIGELGIDGAAAAVRTSPNL